MPDVVSDLTPAEFDYMVDGSEQRSFEQWRVADFIVRFTLAPHRRGGTPIPDPLVEDPRKRRKARRGMSDLELEMTLAGLDAGSDPKANFRAQIEAIESHRALKEEAGH